MSRIYKQMMDSRKRFARKLKMIPTPEFYVFYNGKANYPKEKILKLSDAFLEKPQKAENLKNLQFPLEIIVKVININVGANSEILTKCKPLNEYSSFIDIMHKYSVAGDEKSFNLAIQKAIDAGILSNYLQRRRKEVENMVTGMYDYDLDMEVQREEAAHDARIETARTAILMGMAQDVVAKLSGLPLAEIEQLTNTACDQ